METEVRYYYSYECKDEIFDFLRSFPELTYRGTFYECTDQYNHPMKEHDFYSKEVDGRFRVRKTTNESSKSCMISWKRRLEDYDKELVHREEEVEVSINPDDYDHLCYLLESVLHMRLVDSYERYRSVFFNPDVEIVLDEYPFGICVEIENRSSSENADSVIQNWLEKLHLDLKDAYPLSWDDKYAELCKDQDKPVEKIVRFDKEMPSVQEKFTKE